MCRGLIHRNVDHSDRRSVWCKPKMAFQIKSIISTVKYSGENIIWAFFTALGQLAVIRSTMTS